MEKDITVRDYFLNLRSTTEVRQKKQAYSRILRVLSVTSVGAYIGSKPMVELCKSSGEELVKLPGVSKTAREVVIDECRNYAAITG